MRKLLLVLVIVALCLSAAQAQENKIIPIIYGGGGLGIPMAPSTFSDYWKSGPTFSGGLGLQFSPKAEVIARFNYNTFPLDTDKLLEGFTGVTVDGLDFQTYEFLADLKYIFNGGTETTTFFYLIGGIGFAGYKFTDVTVSGGGSSLTLPASEFSDSSFLLSSGLGLDIMVSPTIGFWVEPRITVVTTEGESTGYLPLRAGFKVMLSK